MLFNLRQRASEEHCVYAAICSGPQKEGKGGEVRSRCWVWGVKIDSVVLGLMHLRGLYHGKTDILCKCFTDLCKVLIAKHALAC